MHGSSGWLSRIAAKVRAVFIGADAPPIATALSQTSVGQIKIIEIPAIVVEAPVQRMLPAQIASTAKLNVPIGRKPRTAKPASARKTARRPKVVAVAKKKTATPTSVYLPARHFAAKTKLKPRSNVVVLPIAAKPARPVVSKQVVAKQLATKASRIAA